MVVTVLVLKFTGAGVMRVPVIADNNQYYECSHAFSSTTSESAMTRIPEFLPCLVCEF
ncbi:hypothetical protein BDZ94DRAFT_1245995 [Collybia nuda]|uniref:Uncharacterized protein n=1 Tax=Collybia nuda TaxID=64659 RepID=A0A9P5YEU5_9AGAR|nr:hypothetical protein BDZ94DRAFT_1245995 [Collybia nuda]